jgi:5'-3' exonuclease
MKLKPKLITPTRINTLLIDGESLLKQGFHGTKNTQTKNGRVGTIFHFVNKIRQFYEEYGITKVVVFWEGENSKAYRQAYYPYYKSERNSQFTEEEKYDLGRQRIRIKQYLEEVFIRQGEIDGCEADDGIAYYTKNAPNENILIFTNDRDLLQLISDTTKVYLSNLRAVINKENFQNYFSYHYGNVAIIKMIAGDTSDNISGIMGVGEEGVIKLFPELKKEAKTPEWISERVDELLQVTPDNKKLLTIKEGKTKWGVYGNDYLSIMKKIISLEQPNVTDELKRVIYEMVNEPLDPEGREGIKAIMTMMREDELLNYLPRNDDAFYTFWNSFITIINKEKKFFEATKNI